MAGADRSATLSVVATMTVPTANPDTDTGPGAREEIPMAAFIPLVLLPPFHRRHRQRHGALCRRRPDHRRRPQAAAPASRAVGPIPGLLAAGTGVVESVQAVGIVRRWPLAPEVTVIVATTGLVATLLALVGLGAGSDPFGFLGGAAGSARNGLAALTFVAVGYLVVIAGARRAGAR
jgi:hypothetical protein